MVDLWLYVDVGEMAKTKKSKDGREQRWERAKMGESKDGREQRWERAKMGESKD
jgi:hypothetical protein